MMDQCTGTLMSINTGSEGDYARLRTAAIMLGGAAAAVAIVQHNRGSVGLHAPGGIVMADAARYDSLTGVLLGCSTTRSPTTWRRTRRAVVGFSTWAAVPGTSRTGWPASTGST